MSLACNSFKICVIINMQTLRMKNTEFLRELLHQDHGSQYPGQGLPSLAFRLKKLGESRFIVNDAGP